MQYDDRLWLSFNGEIYNFIELREELEKKGYKFRTNTDSEVILASYAEWGSNCVDHFNGMFAIIIIDIYNNSFFVARDRYGVKPLYYWVPSNKKYVAFASEIKAFMDIPEWNPKLNGQRAYDYLNYGLTDHTNETLYRGVFQIRGGEAIYGDLDRPIQTLNIYRWYTFFPSPIKLSRDEIAERFYDLFVDSVSIRLRSDVKVGSCLSGGLDSSSIVCVVNDILKTKKIADSQATVSAIAPGSSHDETKYIDVIHKERGITGTFVEPALDDLWKSMNRLLYFQEEPFGSTSIYAQWCVFAKAREEKLTVMLDGQGADELLAGYRNFVMIYFSQLMREGKWGRLVKECVLTKRKQGYSMAYAMKWGLEKFVSKQNNRRRGEWYSLDKLDAISEMPMYFGRKEKKTLNEFSEQLLLYNNLPMLLKYEDRNSMAHSVESRLPFLDYRLVEFIQSLPEEAKYADGMTKVVLRDGMRGVLPERIRMRMDKIGFETPEEDWERENREEFRKRIKQAIDVTDGIINEKALDYFDETVRKAKRDFGIWRIINFGSWYDIFINQNNNR